MRRTVNGKAPQLAPGAYAAENATLVGDVRLEEGASVWYGAVVRGDCDRIVLEALVNVQDNCTLHCDAGHPLTVGRGTTVGHNAVLHGCTIGEDCLIGMNATILNGAVIGDGCVVGAGALVTEGKVFPPNSVILGVPAKVAHTLSAEEAGESREKIRANAAAYLAAAREQFG